MTQKNKKPRRNKTVISQRLQDALRTSERLIDELKFKEALPILEGIARTHPEDEVIRFNIFRCHHGCGHVAQACRSLERLTALCPERPSYLSLLVSYLDTAQRPASLVLAARRFLALFPQHQDADAIRGRLAVGEDYLRARRDDLQTALAPASTEEQGQIDGAVLRAVALSESAEGLLQLGLYAEVLQPLTEVLRLLPRFWPARELYALALLRLGRLEDALREADALLAQGRAVGATGHVVRAQALRWLGREEAAAACAALREVALPHLSSVAAICSALSVIGDDEGVNQVARRARAQFGDPLPGGSSTADILHLEAVSAFHRGVPARAERLWREALRENPAHEEAAHCLVALRGDPMKLGIYALRTSTLMSLEQLQALGQALAADDPTARTRQLLAADPALARLLADVGLYGDDAMIAIMLGAVRVSGEPLLHQAVLKLATGTRGTISARLSAAYLAVSMGLRPPGPTRLWLGNTWHEVTIDDRGAAPVASDRAAEDAADLQA